MADCVIALITADLISALHNKTIEIDGASVTNYAEGQRTVLNTQGKNVYTEVAGPWPEEITLDGCEQHIGLHYVVECHINNINDSTGDPIIIRCKNVGADLAKLIMTDITRGGNALFTKIDGQPYYYFMSDNTSTEFIYRVDVIVQVFIDINDPYFQK